MNLPRNEYWLSINIKVKIAVRFFPILFSLTIDHHVKLISPAAGRLPGQVRFSFLILAPESARRESIFTQER